MPLLSEYKIHLSHYLLCNVVIKHVCPCLVSLTGQLIMTYVLGYQDVASLLNPVCRYCCEWDRLEQGVGVVFD